MKGIAFALIVFVFAMCGKPKEEPFSVFIDDDIKVYLDLPKHCRFGAEYFEPFGPYGLEFTCPFQGREYSIIVGKVHPETRYHEGMFNEPNREGIELIIKNLHKKDSTITDFEFGKQSNLYTFDNGSGRSIFYQKYLRIPKTDRLLTLQIKKRIGNKIEAIEEVKKLGESFRF